jgi:hypothetical protein
MCILRLGEKKEVKGMRRPLESKGSQVALWGKIRRGFWLGFALVALQFGFHLTSAQAQEFWFRIPQQPSFSGPGGVAIDPEGFIWVADTDHRPATIE